MRIIFLVLSAFCFLPSYSQSLTGSWYGKADVVFASGNNYLTELILKQKGDEVEGLFGYYFRDGYKSIFVRGSYDKKTRDVIIKNIPITYFRSANIDGVDCFMDFYGKVIISKLRSSLKGVFTTDSKYRYTCPDIDVNYVLDEGEKNQQDSLIRNAVARKVWQPRGEDLVVTATTEQPMAAPADSVAADDAPLMKLIEVYGKRKNVLAKEVEVSSDSIRLSFYDNGDVDQDSISVFLNNKPVVVKQELTAAALNIYLRLDSTREVNEISMYAENLGLYPPNTALMIINDGKNRYEVYLSSSLTQNAVVRLKRINRSR